MGWKDMFHIEIANTAFVQKGSMIGLILSLQNVQGNFYYFPKIEALLVINEIILKQVDELRLFYPGFLKCFLVNSICC